MLPSEVGCALHRYCYGSASACGPIRMGEARGAHFTIVSDSGQKSAQAISLQFEQMRLAVQAIWPWANVDLNRPVWSSP